MEGTLSDISQQQATHNAAIAHLERQHREIVPHRADDGRAPQHDATHSYADGRHDERPPRFHKMDFPKYDGKGDPLPFINRCELFFCAQRIVEEEKGLDGVVQSPGHDTSLVYAN